MVSEEVESLAKPRGAPILLVQMKATALNNGIESARPAQRVRVADSLSRAGNLCRLIELRRPEKLNCLSLQMLEDVQAALRGRGASQIILAGAGESFCSGLDLQEIEQPAGAKRHLQCLVAIYRQLASTNASTVALVRGVAAGGGVGLFACARTVIASKDLRVLVPKGELATLASVVTPILDLKAGKLATPGHGWVGCDLNADEARRMGLVERVVSPEHLDDLAQEAGNGGLAPELVDSPMREKRAVARTLGGLETFLKSFGRPDRKHRHSHDK